MFEFLTLKCPILTDIKPRSYGKANHRNPWNRSLLDLLIPTAI